MKSSLGVLRRLIRWREVCWLYRIGRVAVTIGVVFVIAVLPSANADTSLRDKCRETSFRLQHHDACQQFYGPGPFTPGDPNPNGGGLLGLIGRVLGGLL